MAATKKSKESSLHVRVSSAMEEVWEGEALAVSSSNSSGPFDILPMHANFITLVSGETITIQLDRKNKREFKFTQAVIFVLNNTVKIFGGRIGNAI